MMVCVNIGGEGVKRKEERKRCLPVEFGVRL